MTSLAGIVLAGGRATRMGGGDKGRLLVNGTSLLDRVTARLAEQVEVLALNANGDPSRFDDLGLMVVPDSINDHPGPLAGVLAGLDWAAEKGASHVLSAAVDTPFFPSDLGERLQAAAAHMQRPFAMACTADPDGKIWRHPTFGLWPVALRDDLRRSLQEGVRKVIVWSARHNAVDVVFPSKPVDPFFNVNTPEDLQKAADMERQFQ